MPEMRGGDGSRKRRKEADLVRFRAERLASGLFRHRAAKFIMELPGRKARAEDNRGKTAKP